MAYLEQQGAVPVTVIPDSDEALAKLALGEAAKMAPGPGPLRDRLEALKVVLAYTKATPATAKQIEAQLASGARLKSCEWLLAALIEPLAETPSDLPGMLGDCWGTRWNDSHRKGEDQR